MDYESVMVGRQTKRHIIIWLIEDEKWEYLIKYSNGTSLSILRIDDWP